MSWKMITERDEDRESRYGRRMGMKSHVNMLEKIVDEIYECGFEEGFRKAHEDPYYGERSSYRR